MDEFHDRDITDFHDVFVEICWSIEHNYKLEKHGDAFVVNKLTIERDRMSYKTDNWNLAPGLYEKVEKLYNTLKELE